ASEDGTPVDYVAYNDAIPWPINPDGLHGSLELADPWSDNDRGRAWNESADFRGTPGSKNSATLEFENMSGNAGPQITQVEARPAAEPIREEIHSSDEVRIDARVLDREGVSSARLEYQAMAAGDYIRRTDARFLTDWTGVEMAYDGDRALFTARLPALPHRTLVRYRIVARDGAASPVESSSPRPGDPEPNHAYFVYDGVPNYTANHRSAFGPPGRVHTGLDRVPVYHVIAAGADIEEALYRRFDVNDNTYRWLVTFVHGSQVHDHVGLRLRSGHRYSWPKRPFALRFNRGNRFGGLFNDGTPYPRKRRRMNLMTAHHDPGKPRGESGVFESLGWRLFREAGVMGATTTFVHLRMVRSAEEHDQFLGDFFGAFLEIQEIDSTAVEDLGRPLDDPSSLYKFEGEPVKVHPDCDASMEDVRAFTFGYSQARPREWFEANLDVPRYLSFRSIVELTDNHDMDSLKNFFYYHNGDSLRWEVLPWDLDNTFGADSSGDEPLRGRVLPHFPIEYRNRFRFLWQVHYDEKRLYRIIDEWRGWIRELADADLDRWDTEPREACPDWPRVSGGNCKQYQPFETRMRNLKLWIRNQARMVTTSFRDSGIPATPSNISPPAGGPAATPVTLRASAFSDPDAADTHAASRWLVIERGSDWAFPSWEGESPPGLLEVTLPAEVTTPGRELAFRVAHRDSTGRWSYLSDPTSFVAGFPDATPPTSPGGVSLEHAGARVVALRWEPSRDLESGVFGDVVRRDGEPLVETPVREPRFADFAPAAGRGHAYDVIAVNGAGLESAPSSALEVEVPTFRALGGWRLPAGGLNYLYDARPGEDAYNASLGDGAFVLDGTWFRSRIDEWNGGKPAGAEDTPGGIELLVARDPEGKDAPASVLSLEDPGNPSATVPPPNNQRLFLLRPAGDAS
ncbi:MAG TPA: CotH kinase family protein, partial [Planctomycetota bacterium]|nr:CotH kinase family protein [Planctomycetota bacterium]